MDLMRNYGAGLVDTRNYYLLGFSMYEAGPSQYDNTLYVHAWEYNGALCLYLNVGCRPNPQNGVSFVDNRVPHFNRFLYFEQ